MFWKMKNNSFFKSFKYAFCGLLYCVCNERNMRFHLTAAFYVILFSFFYNFSAGEYALMFLAIVSVLFSEFINTCIEQITDYLMPEKDKHAAIVKDVSAGAVLICAFLAALVGVYLFFRIEVIKEIIAFFAENIFLLILLLVSVVAFLILIFVPKCKEPIFYDKIRK